MKLGVFVVSVPDWEPLEALEKLAAMGYDGVEWRVTVDKGDRSKPSFWSGNRTTMTSEEVIARAAELKRAADRLDMAMPSLGTYMDCQDLPAVETGMRAASALGAASLRVGPGNFDPKGGSYPVQRDRVRRQYAEVARLAAQYGVRALIETHTWQMAPTVAHAMAILEGLDPADVGIMWDPGNQVAEGRERAPMALELAGEYLGEVHVKNARWDIARQLPDRTTWACASAPVHAGIVDWAEVVAELKRAGYTGWLFFEDFSTDQPLVERLQHNLAWFRKLIG